VLAACSLAAPAKAGEWTERYFGVGSGGDEAAACGQARDHAQGNSFKACLEGRGKRGQTEYTECICASTSGRMHVCNVNLKVRCDGATESSDSDRGGSPKRGEPRSRAGQRVHSIGGTRPGSEVSAAGGA